MRRKKAFHPSGAQIEAVARKAAQKAARIQLRHYETGLAAAHKGVVDLVTKADLESQRVILGEISRAFPNHAILAEEEGVGHKDSLKGPIWVIDPLDGTTNYSHGYPLFAISIAFRDKGQTQFGLAYQALAKELFLAHRGKGATLNGRPLQVSKTKKLKDSLVATGFPYDRRVSPQNNLKEFCYFELAAQCLRRSGSAVLDLVHVACGRLDGFWEPKLSPWDIAAGALIVQEAGGRVTDYAGKPLKDLWCRQIIASNRRIHPELIQGIASVTD